ncbi:MAG: hypothetical protein KDD69_12025 [Bdellovibrionales bacterium]|nr:hypothetical protein [Bdellovibrionales bacterium]
MARKNKATPFNFVVSAVVALGALAFFAASFDSTSDTKETPQPAATVKAPIAVESTKVESKTVAAPDVQPTPSAPLAALPQVNPADIPADLPEDLRQALLSPPPELPDDLKAQLHAPPPELPEDLKQQLKNQPTELPPDLQRQLSAPPPEIPDDIKQALKVPPRVVTIDEVNTPVDPGY